MRSERPFEIIKMKRIFACRFKSLRADGLSEMLVINYSSPEEDTLGVLH